MTLSTNAQLIDEGLRIGGEATGGNSKYEANVVDWYNWGFRTVWGGGDEFLPNDNPEWWWLRKRASLILQPVVDTGTISVTNNSTTATLSASQATSMAGRHLKVDGHADVFIVSAHTAGTATLTLDTVYTGDTASAAAYRLMKLDYDLASDIIRLFAGMYSYRSTRHTPDIAGVDLDRLRQEYPPESIASGVPAMFAQLDDDTVRFSHYGGLTSTDLYRVEYRYIYRPSDLADDTNQPVVPLRYRKVLSYLLGWRIRDDKNQAEAKRDLTTQITLLLRAMKQENDDRLSDIDREYGRLYSREGHRDRFLRPLRTESGHIVG